MTISDKNSFNALLTKAKNGDTDAQFKVADIYSDGLKNKSNKVIVRQNNNLAYKWTEKAAANGDISALNNLGNFVCDGIGCKKDIKKAIEIYKQAISKGHSTSANNLATIYRDKGDYKTAFEYHLLAEKIAKVNYSFVVGLCYYIGLGVSADKVKACKIFSKVSIDKQNCQSQYERDEANYYLGLSYLTGEGVKKSLLAARKYLELADKDSDHRSSEELLILLGRQQSRITK
jgi:TPR repeat protein